MTGGWRSRSALMRCPDWPPENSHGSPLAGNGGAALPVRGDLPARHVEWLRQDDRLAAEAQPYLVAVVLDVIEGEAADHRRPLGAEENEKPDKAAGGFEGVVVEQPTSLCPAGLGVDHPRRPGRQTAAKSSLVNLCHQAQRTTFPVGRPVGLARRWPVFPPGRPADAGQGEATNGEPVEQDDSSLDVPLGGHDQAASGVPAAEPLKADAAVPQTTVIPS